MTAKDRKQMTVSMAKQIKLVAKTVNIGCFSDEEQKLIAIEIMKYSTASEIDNLIEILAMTDITSSKYLIAHPKMSNEIITCTGCGKDVEECGYCEVDGSPYGDCCWSEHIENCKACKEQM